LQVAVLSFPALRPRLQEILWLLESLNSSAWATGTSATTPNATTKQIFMTWFIRIIPMTYFAAASSNAKPEHSREATDGKSQSLECAYASKRARRIDATSTFVICSGMAGATASYFFGPIAGEHAG
jgi:hypothetical protein